MKDNFDLKQFLVENKMTESSRGDVRKHFNKVILSKKVLLENVNIPADPDAEELPMEEAKLDKDALYRELSSYQSKYGQDKGTQIFLKFHPEIKPAELNRIIPRFAKQNAKVGAQQDQARLNRMSVGQEKATRDDLRDPKTGRALVDPRNLSNDIADKDGNIIMRDLKAVDEVVSDDYWERSDNPKYKTKYDDPKHDPSYREQDLDEAGYTDDDDDYADDDFGAMGSNADLGIEDDPRAKKAAQKAMKGTELDADAPEIEEPVDVDAPEGDEDAEAFEDPEDISNDAPVSGGQHFDIQYDPETVEMELEGSELDAYLNHFKRPAVAAKVLQRAINAAQSEVDDSPMFKKKPIYLVLSNGFYKTVTFLTSGSGQKLIAKVFRHANADENMEECNYMSDQAFDAALEEALKKIK